MNHNSFRITFTGIAPVIIAALTAASVSAGVAQKPRPRNATPSGRDVKSVPMKIPGSNTMLSGALVYSDKWGEKDENGNFINPIEPGIVTIQAKPGGKISKIQTIQDLSKMRAGVLLNGIYYVVSTSNQDTEASFSTYSSSNWSRRSTEEIDIVNVPSDLTYDPVTKKVYGFFYNDEYQEYSRFCSFSTYSAEATEIGPGMDRNCFAIAANSQGEIYGIWGYTGWLIKVDSKTGRYEQIGRTGVSPDYINSLTFDDATGKLYWASNDDNGHSALYEVDTATGAATLIMDFENNDSYAGIFAMPYSVPAEAPAAPQNLSVTFSSFSDLNGTVSFTAPSSTFGGAPLSGPLTMVVEAGGKENVMENVSPGSDSSCTLPFPEGSSEIAVFACTKDYRGEETRIAVWAGEDIPGTPESLTLSEKDGKPHLSWKTADKGMNGGLYDTSSVSFDIVRYPGAEKVAENVVANEWTDMAFSGNAALYYEVSAKGRKGTSDPARSEKTVFGEGFTIPFVEGFDTQDAFDLWKIVDLNGKTTWEYSSSKKYIFSKYDNDYSPCDDWIISPRFRLDAGKSYQLTYDASTLYDSNQKYQEDFAFFIGSAPSPDALIQEIASEKNFLSKEVKSRRTVFRPEADGYYYLGLYTNSSGNHWQLNIDNIGIAEIDSRIPAAPEAMKVEAGEKGALTATVSLTAPDKDSEGNHLDKKMDILIFREGSGNAARRFSDVNAGESLEWTDTEILDSGVKTYTALATVEAGDGLSASASTFVGIDVPGPVGNLKAVETDNSVELSWTTPETGANGGYFNPEEVTYRIVRSPDAAVIAENLTATSFSDNTIDLSKQDIYYYLVTPYSGKDKGAFANTDYTVYGRPYDAPFKETFPGADMSFYPWSSESDGPRHTWSLESAGVNPATADHNGDLGLAMFISNESTTGITGSFTSPKVSLASLENPEISFAMYHSPASSDETNETLVVSVKGDSDGWKELGTLSRDNGTTGWQRHAFSLEQMKEKKSIQIRFSAKALGGANFHIDNIIIDSKREADIEAIAISTSSRAAIGIEIPVVAKIANNSDTPLSDITLILREDENQLLSKKIETMDAGAVESVELSVSFGSIGRKHLVLEAKCAADTDASNNVAETSVTITEPAVPAPSGLTASVEEETVSLSWASPAGHGCVTDDMESYKDWAISGIGDWIMTDLDFDVTYHINKDLENYPEMSSPKAFQVCNAKKLGIDIWPQGTPHSGDKMLMAMANINYANNDWMISPVLNGAAHTLSFYAKAFTADETPAERMQVWYSEGSTDPADFLKINSGDYIEVPDSWTEYRFFLPEGARRFSIVCVSENAFSLFIDDVCFNDLTVVRPEPIRYEVYRDDELAGTATEPSFTDNVAGLMKQSVKYSVKAIYPDGLDADSETVEVALSGIANSETSPVAISSRQGSVIIENAIGQAISIFTPDGKTIFSSTAESDFVSVSLKPAVYIVRAADRVVKINHR